MTEPIFDHDRLDVYRLSIEYVASSFAVAKELNGFHRHARDQWLRAAQSIPLNIAEGERETSKIEAVSSTSLVDRRWNALRSRTFLPRPMDSIVNVMSS